MGPVLSICAAVLMLSSLWVSYYGALWTVAAIMAAMFATLIHAQMMGDPDWVELMQAQQTWVLIQCITLM